MVAITWGPDMTQAERTAAQQRWREHRAVLAKEKITDEEKARWASMMRDTWQTIAPDIGDLGCRLTSGLVVELVLDANRCEMHGGMTRDEAEFVSAIYHQPRFQKWARKEMRGYAD